MFGPATTRLPRRTHYRHTGSNLSIPHRGPWPLPPARGQAAPHPALIAARLRATARALEGPSDSQLYGAGLLDAAAATAPRGRREVGRAPGTIPSDLYTDYMPRTMTATETKAKILALLDEVAAGDEVEITKHGHVVARLVPAGGPQALRGTLAGVAMTAAPDEDLFTTGETWNLP